MLRNESAANEVGRRVLRPLAKYYDSDDVEEIAVNKPGEVWIKPRRGDWYSREAPEITYDYISRKVCRVLANLNRSRFSEEEVPIVSCALPGGRYRFQAIVGPNVHYDIGDPRGAAVSVRSLKKDRSIGIETFAPRGEALPGLPDSVREVLQSEENADRIAEAARLGLSIFVSGQMGSGKTTFMNELIRMIPENARVVTVEDTPELEIPHRNRVQLSVPRNVGTNAVGWTELMDVLVRITPDYIVCGEVSQNNAETVFSLMSKGHPVFTTIHAETPEDAIQSVVNNMAMTGAKHDPDSVKEALRSRLGCIIQLNRLHGNGARRIVNIAFPAFESATS